MPTLFHRIVVAVDGSTHATEAVAVTAALDWQPDATTIWVTGVVDVPTPRQPPRVVSGVADWQRVLDMAHADARQQTVEIVAEAAAALRTRHPLVTVEEIIRTGEPAAELLAQIREVDADFVVAGARGRTGLRGLLLGSVSEALVTAAPCPVLVVRDPPPLLETVLIAVRTTEDADRLVDACLRLPFPTEARFDVATVSVPQLHLTPGRRPFTEGRYEAMLHEMTALPPRRSDSDVSSASMLRRRNDP